MTPRSDGSPARTWTRRCACPSTFICGSRSLNGSNNKPVCAKNGPPFGCSIEWNKSFCGASFCTKALVASSTSSGVGASTTATINSNCGKAFSNLASRCRQSIFGEMSWLISVVMEKCVAAYQDASTASRTDRPITGQAFFAQTLMARTTKAVIDFMSELVKGIQSSVARGSTNRRLRLQDRGKTEADTAAGWATGRTLAASARLDALIWRKSEIMDIFLHCRAAAAAGRG